MNETILTENEWNHTTISLVAMLRIYDQCFVT